MMQMQLLTSHWRDAQPVLEEWLRPQTTLPIFYSAWTIWDGMGHHFGRFESAVLLLSLPISLCIPSLLAGRAAREARKSLTQCKHCSETTKISVCYYHSLPKSNIPATMEKTGSVWATTKTGTDDLAEDETNRTSTRLGRQNLEKNKPPHLFFKKKIDSCSALVSARWLCFIKQVTDLSLHFFLCIPHQFYCYLMHFRARLCHSSATKIFCQSS